MGCSLVFVLHNQHQHHHRHQHALRQKTSYELGLLESGEGVLVLRGAEAWQLCVDAKEEAMLAILWL